MPKLKLGEKALKFFTGEITKANDEDRTVEGIASTEAADRDGDVIKQDGWDLKNFKKNAIMPWGHDYGALPVAKIIKTWVDGKKLKFKAKFAGMEQAHPQAEAVYRLFRDGFLNSFSVGFIPKEVEPNKKTGGFIIKAAELLEISAVTVPANPQALATASKSLKLEKNALTELFGEKFANEAEGAAGDGEKVDLEEGWPDEKIFEETENEYRYRVREPELFQQDSFRTIEFQKTPRINAVIGKLLGEDETTLQSLRFPKSDWDREEAQKWIDENKDDLKNKKIDPENGRIKFLLTLLESKHEEMKVMRKYFSQFSEAIGIEKTEDELDTINMIGLKMTSLLSQFKMLQSKTKSEQVKPEENQPATEKERTSNPAQDLIDYIAKS